MGMGTKWAKMATQPVFRLVSLHTEDFVWWHISITVYISCFPLINIKITQYSYNKVVNKSSDINVTYLLINYGNDMINQPNVYYSAFTGKTNKRSNAFLSIKVQYLRKWFKYWIYLIFKFGCLPKILNFAVFRV